MRPTDQEMTVTEKTVCCGPQEEADECHVTLPQGEAPGPVKRRRVTGKPWCLRERMDKAG